MVTLYTQPTCAPCRVVEARLTKAGIPFTKIDVTQERAIADRLQSAGFNGTPVLEHNGKLTSIVGLPDIIKAYAG